MGGPLTGDWAADGRNTNPLSVLDTDLRTATMDRFSSLDPNGEWVLFIADLSAGGVGTLKSFELEISGVPEPSHYSAVGAFALAVWTLIRRFQRKSSTPRTP